LPNTPVIAKLAESVALALHKPPGIGAAVEFRFATGAKRGYLVERKPVGGSPMKIGGEP
jgi:hypothetical protein